MIKNWFIKKTNRETLTYKIIDQIIFSLLKYKNFILNWHFFRKKRIRIYLKNNKISKLHLWCGWNYLQWFLNSDIFWKIPIDITKTLPFKDNTFDLIYSSHVWEHI